ncbi:MAG: hypothetical protein ABI318_22005 [Chthoniobacteraceae bacterium]
MSAGRKVRSATKALDAIKVAIVIIGLLLGCIVVLWVVTHMLQPTEPQPDHTPRPGKSLWEERAPAL